MTKELEGTLKENILNGLSETIVNLLERLSAEENPRYFECYTKAINKLFKFIIEEETIIHVEKSEDDDIKDFVEFLTAMAAGKAAAHALADIIKDDDSSDDDSDKKKIIEKIKEDNPNAKVIEVKTPDDLFKVLDTIKEDIKNAIEEDDED